MNHDTVPFQPLSQTYTATMPSKYLLELDQVTRLYGTVIGVNDFSMKLQPGAYGLLGPNGAGKSTLLNLLIGQLVPTRGTVRVLGESPRNNPALMRRIGFCPGFEGLYARTSGLDWVTTAVASARSQITRSPITGGRMSDADGNGRTYESPHFRVLARYAAANQTGSGHRS